MAFFLFLATVHYFGHLRRHYADLSPAPCMHVRLGKEQGEWEIICGGWERVCMHGGSRKCE